MTISKNFERFQYFNFEKSFLENEYLFQKLEYCSLVESTKIENVSFPYKTVICQKPMLRQMEWLLQNGRITKNGVLPKTTLFF